MVIPARLYRLREAASKIALYALVGLTVGAVMVFWVAAIVFALTDTSIWQ